MRQFFSADIPVQGELIILDETKGINYIIIYIKTSIL